MKKLVILLSGKIKSGKNEAAKILQNYFEEKGLKVTQDYFAKALKEYCRDDFKIFADAMNKFVEDLKYAICKVNKSTNYLLEHSELFDPIFEKINELKIKDENWFENKTFITRSILQLYGTEIFRMRFSENYWVDLMKDKCKKSESDIILGTDLRYPSEYFGMISDNYDIITIRLMRDPNKGKSTHTSETALDGFESFNYLVDNRKNNIKSFEKQIKMVASDIFETLNKEPVNDYLNNIIEPHKEIQKFIDDLII